MTLKAANPLRAMPGCPLRLDSALVRVTGTAGQRPAFALVFGLSDFFGCFGCLPALISRVKGINPPSHQLAGLVGSVASIRKGLSGLLDAAPNHRAEAHLAAPA